MPFVNVKIVKQQLSKDKKQELVKRLTDLIVNTMGRERGYTVITLDELNEDQWAIGGTTLDQLQENKKTVAFINIKVSKGTTSDDEMAEMIRATKDLMIHVWEIAKRQIMLLLTS